MGVTKRRQPPRRAMRGWLWSCVALTVALVLISGVATWFSELASSNHVRTRVSAAAEAPPSAGAVVPVLDLAVPARNQVALTAWATTLSGTVAIPAQALAAYGYAAASQAVRDPECGIGWSTLAGIGAVESHHGSYGGARLDDMGRALPPIIGIPLDGGPGVAAVADTDQGALDDDASLDRAVGPMQFIPQTWRRWGVDADGDGVADPNDLNDAALTAARYLCAAQPNMATAQGWRDALFTYNRSSRYANDVLQHAANYAAGVSG